MSLSSAKAKLDAQGGDPVTGYISKTDHQESYDELVDDTALTGATTAEAITVSGAAVAATINGRDPDDLVKGPASATDNALVRFDGTDGKTVQNSGITVDDSNNVSGVGTIGSGAITSSGAVQAAAASGFVVGSSGPRVMSGTGSPEGVVTAPVGSRWIRTDGDALGDFEYQKRSGTGNTGWVVADGDTGWRNITSLATANAGQVLADFMVRRIGGVVYLQAQFAQSTTNTVFELFANGTWPSGFNIPTQTDETVISGGRGSGSAYTASSLGLNTHAASVADVKYRVDNASYMYFHGSWPTSDAWPSSLPGSAA